MPRKYWLMKCELEACSFDELKNDRPNSTGKWRGVRNYQARNSMRDDMKVGDLVLFYSHVPHQGAKIGEDPEGEIRANIVLHYQQNPMFPGISFVSNPQFALDTLGYAGTFPFAS